MNNRYAVANQLGRWSNSGQHQDLRRLNCTGGEDHFPPGSHFNRSIALTVSNAAGSMIIERQALHKSVGFHVQILPSARGIEIGRRRTFAFAATLEDSVKTNSFLSIAVEIVPVIEPRLSPSLDECSGKWIALPKRSDRDRAIAAVVVRVEAGFPFHAFEVGQDVPI